MEKSVACRICLAADVKIYNIVAKNLRDLYERLASIPAEEVDNQPLLVCYLCYKNLKNCYQFAQRCARSQEMFIQALKGEFVHKLYNEEYVPSYRLTATTAIQVDIEPLSRTQQTLVKLEEPIPTGPEELMLKQENHDVHDSDNNLFQEEDHQVPSDSEDDVPLTKLKTVPEIQERRKAKRKRLKVENKEQKERKPKVKIDAVEIILSKEEQLQDLLARTKAPNYCNAPFQCQLCYKAFVDITTYDNHKVKHDERSGPHACDICSLRYKTIQDLRTHTMNCHARMFKCNKCGHVTRTANQARVHEKWHSGYLYECQLCSKTFKKPTSRLSHIRKQHPTEHVCHICGESFLGKYGLIMHQKKSHALHHEKENSDEAPADRFCKDCNIQFCSLDAWKRHILRSIKHTLKSEQSLQCSICKSICPSNLSLSVHMRQHAKELKGTKKSTTFCVAKVRCQECGANFVSRSKLQWHINRTHLGLKYNKNIVCEVCGKHCTSNATLKYHQRTHTGEKPYSCTTCSKRFADSNQLRIHTRTHTGEKPYVCAVCGKRFTQKPALNRHYRVHTGAKPYSCQYCSKMFSQSNSLKLHVNTVHLKQPANVKKKSTRSLDKDS